MSGNIKKTSNEYVRATYTAPTHAHTHARARAHTHTHACMHRHSAFPFPHKGEDTHRTHLYSEARISMWETHAAAPATPPVSVCLWLRETASEKLEAGR